jgi:cell division cycle protein 20 (cofactor of APC complex)
MDDFYLNLLDWSTSNILAVGLGSCLYLWNAQSGDIELLLENKENDNYVTSVRWMDDGHHVAVGMADHNLMLWNVEKKKQVRSLKGHLARISSLAWNKNILSSGGRDSLIINHDIRAQDHHVSTLQAHDEEICGMAWSSDGSQLASGGNDNMCCIWDKASTVQPRYTFRQHNAAVKALAWCPFQKDLLATGGGTADRHIRFFNCSTGALVSAIDTKSQVCALVWSKTEKEILSAHGFSQNQLTVWKYPSMTPLANLTGHTSRVLHTAISPDGSTICSAAADETLRFWHVWDNTNDRKNGSSGTDLNVRGALSMKIR